jgi:response regulator RpfG family c-di-GMP phosphodiesterase
VNTKRDSPLVHSVTALQNNLSELDRVAGKILSVDMTAEVDVEFVQKLLTRFAEYGRNVADEVRNLSAHLQEAQAQAERVSLGVAQHAEAFRARVAEQNGYLEKFGVIGERVRELNARLRPSQPGDLATVKEGLKLLIGEVEELRDSARNAKIRTVERSAQSLAQSLVALQNKLRDLPA